MDLNEAKAKISELQGQVADKDSALTAAQAKAADAETKLAEVTTKLEKLQADGRNKAVADLEAKTSKTFSDAEKQAFAGMSDDQFALVASMAESNKPVMPASLQQAQITAGNTESTGLAGVIANLTKGASNA